MDTRLEAKFIECLSALDQGESIDQVLVRYPDDASQLRPLLLTAQALPSMRLEPSEATKMKSREDFLQQAASPRHSKRRTLGFLPRFATSLMVGLMAFAIIGVGAVAASGSALPGDPLYGLKRTVENVRLALSPDSLSRGALAVQFDQTRIAEVKSLINANRSAKVDFSGAIQSIQSNAWIVAGVEVLLNGATQINGTPLLGSHARVSGTTGANGVAAASIVIEPSTTPTPVPPTPAPTPTPSIDNTPTPEPTITPELTITPARPITPTIAPTTTPEPTQVGFSGPVQTIGAQSWTINDTVVQVTASTQIDTGLAVGQSVQVTALQYSDGQLIAVRISRLDQPNANPTAAPQPTEKPQPTDRPQPSETPGPTDRPQPTETLRPGDTPEPTEFPQPTRTPGGDG